MNIQRFHAPTSREALAKARMAFGDKTLILSNRPSQGGVEVVATAEDALDQFETPQEHASHADTGASERSSTRTSVAQDTEKLAMSTLSFQEYVRERMLRKRHEEIHGQPSTPPAGTRPAALPRSRPAQLQTSQDPVRSPVAPDPVTQGIASQRGVLEELRSLKSLMEERFSTLTWLGQARQNPLHSSLMLKLIQAGYSPPIARAVLEALPDKIRAPDAVRRVMEILQRNIKTDEGTPALYEAGGMFALIGATGVGKTTTTAKLAALCAREHGAASVGLITLDTYRAGAHEQLRSLGRSLGVVAHLAHDRAALQDLLQLLSGKKMVLIDTTGVAPRDPRTRDMLDVLSLPQVKRLLVLNAAAQGDAQDEALTTFKSAQLHGALLSKIDEAVKLAPALDNLIRHQTVLRGTTDGQRVPEDWARADAARLVRLSMCAPGHSALDPKETEVGFFFSQPAASVRLNTEEHRD